MNTIQIHIEPASLRITRSDWLKLNESAKNAINDLADKVSEVELTVNTESYTHYVTIKSTKLGQLYTFLYMLCREYDVELI